MESFKDSKTQKPGCVPVQHKSAKNNNRHASRGGTTRILENNNNSLFNSLADRQLGNKKKKPVFFKRKE